MWLENWLTVTLQWNIYAVYKFLFNSISSQIFWPASTSKVEECQMAGKDPTVRTLTLPNTRKFMFGHLFHVFDSQWKLLDSWIDSYLFVAWWSDAISCIILSTITAINETCPELDTWADFKSVFILLILTSIRSSCWCWFEKYIFYFHNFGQSRVDQKQMVVDPSVFSHCL